MNREAMTLRTYALTDMEAQTIYDCLNGMARLPYLSDEALIWVLELRDRFKPQEDDQ
jgi:hypothetical protein